jgi:CysZ protein
MLVRALSLSVAQVSDRRIVAIFAKSLTITLILFAALGAALLSGSHALARWAGLDGETSSYVTIVVALAGLLIGGALFRAIAVPVLGFFGDEVVAAVESAHYPTDAQTARPASILTSSKLATLSLGRFLIANLIALPAYLFLLLTGVGPIILFILVNAVLLGRDLGEMVAVRHCDAVQMKRWLRATRLERSLLGLAVSGLFMIPFVNLIAPMLGAAAMTHLFHGRRT